MGKLPEHEPDRATVKAAVVQSWPHEADAIMREMKWDGLNGCWFIERYGMVIGIERDGYIHS